MGMDRTWTWTTLKETLYKKIRTLKALSSEKMHAMFKLKNQHSSIVWHFKTKNKRYSVSQRIKGQRNSQQTAEDVPSSAFWILSRGSLYYTFGNVPRVSLLLYIWHCAQRDSSKYILDSVTVTFGHCPEVLSYYTFGTVPRGTPLSIFYTPL